MTTPDTPLPNTLSDAQREITALRASKALLTKRLEQLVGMDAALSVTTPDEQTLLPCPFCGSNNVKAGHGVRYAECSDCDAMGPTAHYPENAISAWNTRAAMPDTKALEAADWFAITDRVLDELQEHDSDLTSGSEIDNVRAALRAARGGKA